MYTARDNQNRHDVRTIARRPPPFSGISTGEKSWLWVVIKVALVYKLQRIKRILPFGSRHQVKVIRFETLNTPHLKKVNSIAYS